MEASFLASHFLLLRLRPHRLECCWSRCWVDERLKRLQTLLIALCPLLEQFQSELSKLLLYGGHVRFQVGKFFEQVRFCLTVRSLNESQTGVRWRILRWEWGETHRRAGARALRRPKAPPLS